MRKIFLFVLALCPLAGSAITAHAGPYRIEVATDPPVIQLGKASLTLEIADGSGHPVTGADVKVLVQMPGMPMGERDLPASPTSQPGEYRVPASFAMAGLYDARISVSGPLGIATTKVTLETGKSSEATSPGWTAELLPFMGGAATVLALILVWKARRSIAARLLTPSVLISVASLAAVLGLAVFGVNHYRRPGAMTPVEAQTMDMAVSPPPGTTPVSLAVVEAKSFQTTVTYAGQAVAFSDAAVASRTTGVVESVLVYVGDRVRKGQLLAKIDAPQVAPAIAEKRAGLEGAISGVNAAQADARQAHAMQHQAESEAGQYDASVAESEAQLQGAKADREAADARLAEARADEQAAQAKWASAKADADYWTQEIRRETDLFRAGAVSREEFDKERAESAKATAELQSAQRGIEAAKARLVGAAAAIRRASADVSMSERKHDEAVSQRMVHHAHVNIAEAEVQSAQTKIGVAEANSRQAAAQLAGASVEGAYTQIVAPCDGYVTERMVSPGSLVSPGQVVIKLAQLTPIRLQANVAEADLAKVRIGATVNVRLRGESGNPVAAAITSIAPSVDPTTRMGTVEAVYANPDMRFRAGEFISMDVSFGVNANSLVIPTSAVWRAPDGDRVWVASEVAGQGGVYTVAARRVTCGSQSAGSIVVADGLKAGERIATSSVSELAEDDSVTAAGPTNAQAAVREAKITVNGDGYSPSSIVLDAHGPRRLIFTRTTNETCATDVEFPQLGISRSLPLNKPVTIDLPPSASGAVHFQCSMNMKNGVVVLQ